MWLKDNLNREAQINGFWKNKKIVTQLYGATGIFRAAPLKKIKKCWFLAFEANSAI